MHFWLPPSGFKPAVWSHSPFYSHASSDLTPLLFSLSRTMAPVVIGPSNSCSLSFPNIFSALYNIPSFLIYVRSREKKRVSENENRPPPQWSAMQQLGARDLARSALWVSGIPSTQPSLLSPGVCGSWSKELGPGIKSRLSDVGCRWPNCWTARPGAHLPSLCEFLYLSAHSIFLLSSLYLLPCLVQNLIFSHLHCWGSLLAPFLPSKSTCLYTATGGLLQSIPESCTPRLSLRPSIC